MSQFPILYSKTATGAIQEWQIEVQDNKYRVISGQTDGKKVINEWTICSGKNTGKTNKTSSSEQAISEAKSKWDKKLKTGYTSDINKVDNCTSFVEPMLAKPLKNCKKIDFSKGLIEELKYNGVRCIATLEDGKVVLKSRTGEYWLSVPHINKDLESFFDKYPDAVLDGELYNYDLRQHLNKLNSLVRQTKDITVQDIQESEKIVRFYIYDGYSFDGLESSEPYIVRKKWIETNLPKYSKYYRRVNYTMVYSMEEVNKKFNQYLADGEEGIILRVPNSPYEHKRSKYLIKHKPQDDLEGIILELHEGEGNWSGTIKTASMKWKDKEFKATFKGSWEKGEERFKNPKKWIGAKVTFLYNGFTGLGVPNYAQIDPDNCFKGDR